MSFIRVLPVDLRNKIAAGEVVERPASVVKELIENAIDANSTEIKIEVLHGGKRMIKVSDNGTGMDREDALLCFERHATSKIISDADLFNIRTLGFRGEALPSIAAVSKVKLITGLKGASAGISVEMRGSGEKEVRESSFSGTSIEIRDLFFNTPARKKFLKTNNTELFHIIDTVTKEALSHPEITFSLFTDNQEAMSVPRASGFRERIMQIYGDEFLKELLALNSGKNSLAVSAFVSSPQNFRNSRTHQFLFINRRPVKDQSVSHAVYSAYEGILPKDKHPVFFIFMEIDPAKVDFNVHPAKREVRFEDKELVHDFISAAIRNTVREERKEYTKTFLEQHTMPGDSADYAAPFSSEQVSENLELNYMERLPSLYLGDTFIAVSGKRGLTIIDHHAAHERILFEKFLKNNNLHSHQLLFPKQTQLSNKEYRILLENTSLLNEFGVEIEDFGHDTVLIRSLPDVLHNADLRGILSDIASAIGEGIRPDTSLREEIAASIACHSSVRGREILNQEEVSRLLADLEQTVHPDQCPHGRPTRIFFSMDDLKKLFKRK